jgi:CMP-N-acetylneuraminic acid synthetase
MDLTDLSTRIYYAIGKANSLRESSQLTKAQRKFQQQQFDKAVLQTLEKAATDLEAYLQELGRVDISSEPNVNCPQVGKTQVIS